MAPLSGKAAEKAVAAFKEVGVCEELASAAADLGWPAPSPIQAASLPHTLERKDVIALAQTGSGKTGAFALPVLQALLESPQRLYAAVLSPTRELAIQIAEQFEALGGCIGVRCATVVGGVDMMAQAVALAKRPHIIVGTPGRLVDHLKNTKGFNLRNLKWLVLDEADRLLNMDFEAEIDELVRVIPRERHTLLFSATMTSKVAKLQRACLREPVKVEVSSKYQTVDTLRQQYLFLPAMHKDVYLAYVLNELAGSTAILFVRTCESARRIALLLRNLGFGAVPIHGQMSQPKRLGALTMFKAGERPILVATGAQSARVASGGCPWLGWDERWRGGGPAPACQAGCECCVCACVPAPAPRFMLQLRNPSLAPLREHTPGSSRGGLKEGGASPAVDAGAESCNDATGSNAQVKATRPRDAPRCACRGGPQEASTRGAAGDSNPPKRAPARLRRRASAVAVDPWERAMADAPRRSAIPRMRPSHPCAHPQTLLRAAWISLPWTWCSTSTSRPTPRILCTALDAQRAQVEAVARSPS